MSLLKLLTFLYILGYGSFAESENIDGSPSTSKRSVTECAQFETSMKINGRLHCVCDEDNGEICKDEMICEMRNGTKSCECPQGYEKHYGKCFDVNECLNDRHDCPDERACENLPGSFNCICPSHYYGNETFCYEDIFECTQEDRDCINFLDCLSTKAVLAFPQYNEIECVCSGLDACNETAMLCYFGCKCYSANEVKHMSIESCASRQSCALFVQNFCYNAVGSMQFILTRSSGKMNISSYLHFVIAFLTVLTLRINIYSWFSSQKCKTSRDCPDFAYCSMKVCNCNSGFIKQDHQCVDINDCDVRNTCSVNAACENHPGGHSCRCLEGYMGDGRECIDVDECNDIGSVCQQIETCQNEQGSYKCFCNGKVCHGSAYCLNERGKIGCVCGIGFAGDGQYCQDVNECFEGTHNCTKETICKNTHGSFTCNSAAPSIAHNLSNIVVLFILTLWCSNNIL
ncbi:uncharacterized protein LOC120326542 [Styela clava]